MAEPMVWSRPDMNGTPPCARGGHSATLADTQLVLFGGHYYGKGSFVYLNDVHVLDVETSTWHDVRCAGEPPPPRYGHTATLVGRRMFVFGGRGENNVVLKDMYLLDLDEWCWVKVNPTTTAPTSRFDHADVLIGNKIVIFGGWDGKQCFDDLWVFDTEAFTWMKPKTAGTPPRARHGCKMEILTDGRITVFGGHSTADLQNNLKNSYNNDIRTLDTETMIWSRPRVTGDMPSGRYGHTMCRVGNALALVGGWAGVRRSMVFEYLPVPDNFEERDISMLTEYMHFLDTGMEHMAWIAPPFTGVEHPHRYGHTTNLVGDYLFVFGGWDGNRPMNDLQVLDVSAFTQI